MTWHLLYLWHNIHCMWPYLHCICVMTPILSMISLPTYMWYHIWYTCDILPTIYMISYPLCMTTQHCVLIPHSAMCDIICTTNEIISTLSHQTAVFMMSHPLRAWHHNHSIRHRTHCIFVITTSPLISYPLLYDIVPTPCVTSCALYITSYQLLMSSHFCTYDITASIYETTSNM